ncbi:hypothetical protein Q8A67_011754 [Cirrhinus molitorella]|uniref:Uncharacterized protein n=1 Tax=Cirrhinus molitorella TaxID=172907 RepID=A0AA88PQU3_9TELE|nr:hypothetical protein Q8A67_011754 [Cirrhinus molitorella]
MVAPMADNCSPQETPMPRLFTLGLYVPASSSWKREVQKGQSQACLFQKRREYKPQASLRQRELKSVKPPQTSPVLQCSPQAAPMLQGDPVLECCSQGSPAETPQKEPVSELFPAEALIPEGSPQRASSLHRTPKDSSSPHGAPMPKLFTLGISIPAPSTRNFHVLKGRSQCSCQFQKRQDYKRQASLKQRAPEPVKPFLRSPVPGGSPQECSSKKAPVLQCSPQAAPMLQGDPVLECCSQGTPAETPKEEPVSELFPAKNPWPRGHHKACLFLQPILMK